MTGRDTWIGGSARDFPSTHWSILRSLRDRGDAAYGDHLNELIRGYWKPVYHYARALRSLPVEDAKDLTQQFFAMLLARRDLEKLSEERGSFRGFLKTALRHFLSSADRAAQARQPHDGATLFHFDAAEADWQAADRAMPEATPDAAFDREWAHGVLADAVTKLEEALSAEGKGVYARLFRDYCVDPAEPVSYTDLAARYGIGEEDVRNHLRYARQRIREILRGLVKSYAGSDEDVEGELRFVLGR